MVQRTLPDASGPIRMCVGCRQRASASVLVRIVARRGGDQVRIVVDVTRTMPGRGAWLHPGVECVALALRRKAFGPALRERGMAVSPEDLAEVVGADR